MSRHLAVLFAAVLAIGTVSWLAGPTCLAERTKRVEVTLGIASMSFSGDMVKSVGRPAVYRFSSEPRIRKVDPEGPAAGILRRGDVIVAIDGYLITTREGGLRFGNLAEGRPVTLTVRRWGLEKDVVVVPEVARESAPPALWVPEPGEGRKLARPVGWLGLGLACRGMTIETGNGNLEWHFEDLPRVQDVDPDSPARQSGFERGDLLVSLDGLRLDTEEGSRRFSAIEPGQELVWTVRRAGREMEIRMRAGAAPR